MISNVFTLYYTARAFAWAAFLCVINRQLNGTGQMIATVILVP